MNFTRVAAALSILAVSVSFIHAQEPAVMSADQAVAAVEKAIARAESGAPVLASIPVEYASILMIYPYASEKFEAPNTPDAKAIAEVLKIKFEYWRAAGNALRTEGERLNDDIDAMSRNGYEGVTEAMARSVKISRALMSVSAILADIESDQAVLSSGPAQGGQAMIDRKAALCRRLIAQKPSQP